MYQSTLENIAYTLIGALFLSGVTGAVCLLAWGVSIVVNITFGRALVFSLAGLPAIPLCRSLGRNLISPGVPFAHCNKDRR